MKIEGIIAMQCKLFLLAALAATSMILLQGHDAQAQTLPSRTWVSASGSDSNDCSRSSPCRTFAVAVSKTIAGGEVGALDAGNFGVVTITKSISIVADGAEGGITPGAANAILISAGAADVVHLHGLILEGANAGLNGIKITSAKNVYIGATTIRGFNSLNNLDGCGININSPTNPVRVYLRNVEVNNNRIGACVTGTGSAQNSLFVENSTFEGNSANALVLSGARAGAGAIGSIFAPTGMVLSGGATFASTGNNRIAGAVGPTSTLPLR